MTSTFVVECFWPGVTRDRVEGANRRARESAAMMRDQGCSLRFLGALFVPGDEIVFFHFRAGSADDVVRASHEAALPFDRVTASLWLQSEDEPLR